MSPIELQGEATWGTADELSAFETMMWRAEVDPALRSSGVVFEILDHAPDWDRLVAGHRWALQRIRRMRQRVQADPARIGQPAWVDTDVDLSEHLRRERLPEGSTMADALEVAARVHEQPLDPDRPLWGGVLVEGLADGRAVYLFRLHHAMADGTAVIQLLDLIHSDTADPTVSVDGPIDVARPRAAAGRLGVLARNSTRQVRRTPGRALRGVRRAAGVARRPLSTTRSVVRYLQSLGRMAAESPGTPSPLLRERSLDRALFFLDVPVGDLRAAGKAMGGTLNDAYLAFMGAGLRRYHEAQGTTVDEVPMGMPISLRKEGDEVGGNRFAGARIALPVAEPDAATRVSRIRQQVLIARDEPALDLTGASAPVMSRVPTALLTRATAGFTSSLDLQASNFRGLDRPAYMAGAEVQAVYPFGPVPGCAMMSTLISHNGGCCVGVAVDAAAVTDPDLLHQSLEDAIDEVLAVAGRSR